MYVKQGRKRQFESRKRENKEMNDLGKDHVYSSVNKTIKLHVIVVHKNNNTLREF